jgi:hypothetical protein
MISQNMMFRVNNSVISLMELQLIQSMYAPNL